MFPMRHPLNPSGLLTSTDDDARGDSSVAAIQAILREAALYKQRATQQGATAYLGKATAGERGVPDRRFLRNVITHTLAHNRAGGGDHGGTGDRSPSRRRHRRKHDNSDTDDHDRRDGRPRPRSRASDDDDDGYHARKRCNTGCRSGPAAKRSARIGEAPTAAEATLRRQTTAKPVVDSGGAPRTEDQLRQALLRAREAHEQSDAPATTTTTTASVGPTKEMAFGGKCVRGRGNRKFLKRKPQIEEDEASWERGDVGERSEEGDDGDGGRKKKRRRRSRDRSPTSSSSSSSSESDSEEERKRKKRRKRRKERKEKRKEKRDKKKHKREKKKSPTSNK
ncbi:uncharacterized protein ACA1_141810 [Acanthamoeba castellanii str. Neff]|uniref:Uncharacterized protein n=1 Tax=Acanthamoeba castellanii (strain ATCC 30010 / Neff) TaxID=1257118 RepID=L8HB61_ACACF|nr:uncharacterized protein ACA1_141810 [Acanthamoeba castellanii str. Neff]ELR22492.1 hypothetical protein ACA1_141810 [Acanthamoeba castellanii str. Neff]